MRIITGDDTGLIKQILIENKRIQRWGTQSRENGVECMTWAGDEGNEENELGVVLRNGHVQVWDVDQTEIVKEYTGIEGTACGMGILRNQEMRHVVSCTTEGSVYLFKWDEEEAIDSFDVNGPVSKMRLCPYNNKVFAVGGRENDIALYDIEQKDAIFRGRNVPNDFLNLRVPIWVADMQFLSSDGSTHKLAVVTGHHQIRLYDTRAQRRPVQSVEIGDRPFTCCRVARDDSVLYTGDTTGRVSRIDLRTLRLSGTYKGNTGSVRDIAIHPTLPRLATVGLDRIMRVFDSESRQQLHRVYLRQQLNAVLFTSEEEVKMFAEEESEESDVDNASDVNESSDMDGNDATDTNEKEISDSE
ncbi:hypothetical protein WA577_003627 [Blastocystis sp. JDR]